MQINLQETAVPIKNEESDFWKQPSALEDYPDQIPQVFEGKWYLHLGSLREEISLAVENKQIKWHATKNLKGFSQPSELNKTRNPINLLLSFEMMIFLFDKLL